MLRTVEEIKAQTEEAYENYIMSKIEVAANDRQCAVTVACEDIPNFLVEKLRKYGYDLKHASSVNNLVISWEV
jgi:hypothetical protein